MLVDTGRREGWIPEESLVALCSGHVSPPSSASEAEEREDSGKLYIRDTSLLLAVHRRGRSRRGRSLVSSIFGPNIELTRLLPRRRLPLLAGETYPELGDTSLLLAVRTRTILKFFLTFAQREKYYSAQDRFDAEWTSRPAGQKFSASYTKHQFFQKHVLPGNTCFDFRIAEFLKSKFDFRNSGISRVFKIQQVPLLGLRKPVKSTSREYVTAVSEESAIMNYLQWMVLPLLN